MQGNNFYDPGLHLFLDDVEVQDHPGFVRKVQRPERVRTEPVLRPDQPWEGERRATVGLGTLRRRRKLLQDVVLLEQQRPVRAHRPRALSCVTRLQRTVLRGKSRNWGL